MTVRATSAPKNLCEIGILGECAQKEVLWILSRAELTPDGVTKYGWYRIGGWWFPAKWFEIIEEEAK